MKRSMKTVLSLLLALACILICFAFVSCDKEHDDNGDALEDPLWKDATYTSDKTFGDGGKTVQVEVKAGKTSVTFTVKTDKETLADALLEHGLIAGDEGPFGLYIKYVNGILADYDVDQTYWGLTQNGETTLTGASEIAVADGERYEFTRTK